MNKHLSSKYGKNKIANVLIKYNYQVKIGDILAGTVIGKERKEMLIDLGLKYAAFLPNTEISNHFNKNYEQILPANKFGEFIILNYNKNLTIVSLKKLNYLRLWERFKQIDFNNMILFTQLKKSIWGGKLVEFDKLNSFIPNFHLPKYYRRRNTVNKILAVKILLIKNKNYNIIGSSRLAVFKKQSPSLYIGLVQKCYIIGIKPYGIFLNIYGLKSLLHISEISDKKIENICAVYKKGDQIKVKIIYINNSKGKVAVSLKN
jgi:small subunit ribosomal protein S1